MGRAEEVSDSEMREQSGSSQFGSYFICRVMGAAGCGAAAADVVELESHEGALAVSNS